MDPLPIFCFLLILEVGLGCKTEYTRKVKQGTNQKNIRQGRQTDSFEPICELRDPRRFLQALVVSQLLQPTKLEQTRKILLNWTHTGSVPERKTLELIVP